MAAPQRQEREAADSDEDRPMACAVEARDKRLFEEGARWVASGYGGWHRLPLASWLLVQLLNFWCACLHWFCQWFFWELEPVLSTFMIGGLFGLSLPPLFLMYKIFRVVFGERVWYALAAYGVWYAVSCARDDSPVRPTGVGQAVPQNFLEKAAAKFWTSHFRYNPTSLTVEDEKAFDDDDDKDTRRFLFAVHPHGIHCWPLNMLSFRTSHFHHKFPRVECAGLCASVMFKLPVIRESFLCMGYVDARRAVAEKALAKSSLFVCTGGEKEAMATKKGVDHVVLANRKGFVRLAMQQGADLVPVFGFGCSDLYETYDWFAGFRNWLQTTFAIAIPIFAGRFGGPLPFRIPLRVVVGEPLTLPKKMPGDHQDPAWPPADLVDKAHTDYVDALTKLHKKHASYGRVLKII